MSNQLAIATVTAALDARIQTALDRDVPGATVRLGRPDGDLGRDPVVNLYLYQVTPNPSLRNRHLPSRGADGRQTASSRVALDLHYLLSFYGDGDALQPERMLGSVLRALEHEPLFTSAFIDQVIADHPQTLAGSDLHRAAEPVRVQPGALNLDELSRLWSVFFQVPYALSVVYQASTLIVEADALAGPAPPVTRPAVGAVPLGGPRIDTVEALEGPAFPIVWGDTARIRGRGLGAEGLGLRVGEADAVMDQATVGPEAIDLPLANAALGGTELAAGIHPVQAVLPPPPGSPAHLTQRSGSVPLVLRSVITLPADALHTEPAAPGDPVDGHLDVTFSPRVQAGQEARLLLDRRAGGGPLSRVLAPETVAEDDFPVTTLRFPFQELAPGTYLLRALVDGVESAPELDTDPDSDSYRQIVGPEVTVP